MKKIKIIQVPPGTVDKMTAAYKVSRATLYNALAYKSNSTNAIRIREGAIKYYGGVKTTKNVFLS